ncbi:hypothetical protein AX15_005267 [Amanita polypyramis BW_CC]|nr:hypothetical protein AX15_005267 [Amanita polypyramis BW_CC]
MLSLAICLARPTTVCKHDALAALRRYAAALHDKRLAPLQQLENENARILQVIRKKIEERTSLQSQLTPDMSTPEDIKCLKQLKETEPLQNAWDQWNESCQLLADTTSLLGDPDPTMRTLAEDEYKDVSNLLSNMLNSTFPSLLVPPSTSGHMSALMELKSGVGGSESSLFLSDLLRMYLRLANEKHWKVVIVSKSDTDEGGVKDAVVEFKGNGAYDALRWESGVHRVQRVPATEAQGRVHTSTIAVIVLPLPEESESNGQGLFSIEDVKIEVMRARGAGGQHVNKTESAVRLTHVPTGITVSMQDERSQHQNKRRAFQVLSARLMNLKLIREMEERRATRKNLVRTVDRSEKIRTYNYPQDRVTDHRIGRTVMNLASVLEGNALKEFIDALRKDYEEGIMESVLNEGEK